MESYGMYIFLGIIQGITEFLPVSSSGHLVIIQNMFNVATPQVFLTIILHLGTCFAVVYFLQVELKFIFKGLLEYVGSIMAPGKPGKNFFSYEPTRLAFLLFVACIPTGIMGIVLEDYFEKLFGSLLSVGISLILTGFILFISRWFKQGNRGIIQMGYNDALIAGLAQGIAITPGISRSGITIVVLLFLGIEKEFSAKFSFLLAVPVIMGASLVEFRRISNLPPGIILPMGLGFIISAISGFLALSILLSTVKKGRLSWFAYYCWIIGIIVIILETVLSLF